MPDIVRTKTITVTDGASGTLSFLTTSDSEFHHIKGAVTTPALSGDLSITYNGTLKKGMVWKIQYNAHIDKNGHNLTIFGEVITDAMALNDLHIVSFYDGTKFVTVVMPNFAPNVAFIGPPNIDPAIVDAATLEMTTDIHIKDEGVTLAKLQDFTTGYILIGDAGGRPALVSVTGDISISATGVVTIGNTVIGTTKIVDEAVTLDKIQDITRGYIMVGGTGDRPALLNAKTSAYLIIGNGTDVISVALSGDASITAGGVLTVGNNAITTAKIMDANVTLAKLENLASGKIIVGNASNRPVAVTPAGDLTMDNSGNFTIGAEKVLSSHLAPGAITKDLLTKTSVGGGVYDGPVAAKVIQGADFKALLDGTTNSCFTINSGEVVLGMMLFVQTVAGTACTIAAGPDSVARSAGADEDGILKDANANALSPYIGWNNTYMGALQAYGFFTADGAGYITVRSSANISGTAFNGGLIMFYIANN